MLIRSYLLTGFLKIRLVVPLVTSFSLIRRVPRVVKAQTCLVALLELPHYCRNATARALGFRIQYSLGLL